MNGEVLVIPMSTTKNVLEKQGKNNKLIASYLQTPFLCNFLVCFGGRNQDFFFVSLKVL